MPNLGLSFSPFNQQPNKAAPGETAAPVQDAIKILSFRMPTVAGASAPAPQALMGGQTALGGQMGPGLLQEFLRRLLQGQGPQTPPMGSPSPFAPSAPTSPFQMPQGPSAPPMGNVTASALTPNVSFVHPPITSAPEPDVSAPTETSPSAPSAMPMGDNLFSRMGGRQS